MKLEYKVGDKEYLRLLEWQLEISDSKLFRKILFYGGNIIFSLIAIYYSVSGSSETLRVLLPIMAALLWFFGVTKRKQFIGLRAKNILSKLKAKKAFEEGYFGKHRLFADESSFTLEYGKSRQQLGLTGLTLIKYKDIYIINAGSIAFEIMPESVNLENFPLPLKI